MRRYVKKLVRNLKKKSHYEETLSLACTCQVPGFYQGCNSERDIIIKANAEYEPLYGAGPSLQQAMLENRHIPLGLIISLKSHVNVFGNIVLKYFIQTHVCNVMLNPNTGTVTATYCEPPRKQEGYDISRFKRHSP